MINPVYEAIFNYADRIGARDIGQLPDAWSHAVNDEWRIIINPLTHVATVVGIGRYGSIDIFPMHCAIFRNDQLVADVSPFDCFHVAQVFDRDEFIGVINHAGS